MHNYNRKAAAIASDNSLSMYGLVTAVQKPCSLKEAMTVDADPTVLYAYFSIIILGSRRLK